MKIKVFFLNVPHAKIVKYTSKQRVKDRFGVKELQL